MQPPAKLVVRGVPPDSPLFPAVVRQFSGRMRTFHAKQQQNYAASELPIHRAHIAWHDGRAKYTNIQGQETLELEVPTAILEEIEKILEAEQQRKPQWDFAVIEVEFPDATAATGYCSAWLTKPNLGPIDVDTGITPGSAFDQNSQSDDGSVNPITLYPPLDPSNPRYRLPTATGPTNNKQLSTLLVDMRHKTRNQPWSLDIHCVLSPSSTSGRTCEIIGYSHVFPPATTVDTLYHEWIDLLGWSPITPFTYSPDPDEYFVPADYSGDYPATGVGDYIVGPDGVSYGTTFTSSFDVDTFEDILLHDGVHTGHYQRVKRYKRVLTSVPVFTPIYDWVYGPDHYTMTETVTIRGTVISGGAWSIAELTQDGVPMDGGSCGTFTTASQDFFAWTLKSTKPLVDGKLNIPGLHTLGTATATTVTGDGSVRYGWAYLCTITYDPNSGQVRMDQKGPTLG